MFVSVHHIVEGYKTCCVIYCDDFLGGVVYKPVEVMEVLNAKEIRYICIVMSEIFARGIFPANYNTLRSARY